MGLFIGVDANTVIIIVLIYAGFYSDCMQYFIDLEALTHLSSSIVQSQ